MSSLPLTPRPVTVHVGGIALPNERRLALMGWGRLLECHQRQLADLQERRLDAIYGRTLDRGAALRSSATPYIGS